MDEFDPTAHTGLSIVPRRLLMTERLPSLKPLPIKERLSILYIEHGPLDVLDGAKLVSFMPVESKGAY